MEWQVDPSRDTPPWRQLVDLVLDAVAAGALEAGAQLPSVRGMASQTRVNHNTVARAYRDLEQLGVVRGENGRGVFLRADGPARARELRCAETLDGFRRAALDALRAGHSMDDLFDSLKRERRFSA